MTQGRATVSSARSGFVLPRHLPALDGLRALAIAGVVWHHCLPCAYPGWLGRGHAGVPLFFALSGFLITTLLCAEQRVTGDIALGPFWMRRSLRIFPLYYAVLAGFCLFLWSDTATDATRHFFASLPFYATYTSNWFVDFDVSHPIWFGFAWSLATEEQFYLWWPPLLRVAARFWRPLGWVALLAILSIDQLAEFRVLATWLPPGGTAARIAESSSAAMALGALLALGMAHPTGFALCRRLLGARHATAACLLLAGAWLWQPLGPPLLLDLAFAGLVGAAALARGEGLVERTLASRPLVRIGRVSYGMYLLHIPVLGVCKHLLPALVNHPSALFPLVFALSFGAASLSYRYLEAPLLAQKERFRPRPLGESSGPRGPAAPAQTAAPEGSLHAPFQ